MAESENKILQFILQQLEGSGWKSNDVLRDQSFYSQAQIVRFDLVLTNELYPLAIVEVKRILDHPGVAIDQASRDAASAGLPFTFLTDGQRIFQNNALKNEANEIERFPSPVELWTQLGREWNESDPRWYRGPREPNRVVDLPQILAVSRALDRVLSGHKRALITMPAGTGKTYVASQIAAKLIGSHFCQRMLYLSTHKALIQYVMHLFEPIEEVLYLSSQPNMPVEGPRFQLAVTTSLFSPVGSSVLEMLPADFFDLIIIDDADAPHPWLSVVEHFPDAICIGLARMETSQLASYFGQPIFTFSLKQAIEVGFAQPPDGFRAVTLDQIADIRGGFRAKEIAGRGGTGVSQGYLLKGKDITSDGALLFNTADRINPDQVNSDLWLRPNDILLLAYGSSCKVAIIPPHLPDPVTFAHTLFRIRVDPQRVRPKDVLDFFKSDSGQLALRNLIHGTAVPFLSIQQVRKMAVFLPQEEGQGNLTELSAASRVLRYLRQEVIPILEKAEQGESDTLNREDVATKLRQLASTLIPPSFADMVLQDYPTPIALAYRRFHEARFNAFERILRLRDLIEAASFFLYNITLADMLQRLDPNLYYVEDKGVRKAYNYYSMKDRMEFVGAILNKASHNKGQDLFIPEMIEALPVITAAKSLQEDLRNPLSHTAAATESRQRRLLEQFQPKVEEMLAKLEFLAAYRLVRIPAFYFSRGQLICQLEIYKGVVPFIDEQPLGRGPDLIRADRDHIVLLDTEDDVLDLYPLYQLIANEATQDEKHLCFFKQRKALEKKLEGESVSGAFGIELEGFNEFEVLLAKFQDRNKGEGNQD